MKSFRVTTYHNFTILLSAFPIESLSLIVALTVIFFYTIPISGKTTSPTESLRVTYWTDMASDSTIPFNLRIAGIDSLLQRNTDNSPQLLYKKAKLLTANLMYSKSIEVYEKLWNYAADMSIREKLNLLRDWSIAMGMAGRSSGAAQKAIEIIRMPKPDSLKVLEVDAYVMLAFSKMELDIVDNAYKELNMAQKILDNYNRVASEEDTREMELTLIRAKVTFLTEKGKHKEALKLMKRAFELADDEITIINLNGYVADIYLGAGDYEAAERYYKKILNTDHAYHNRAVMVCNYMHLLVSQHRYTDALELLDSNINRIPHHVNDMVTTNLIANKSEALAGLGRYEEAYELMRSSKAMRDSLNTAFMAGDRLAISELELETQQKEKALSDAVNLKKYLWIIIAVLSATCALCIWTIIKWRQEKKINYSSAKIMEEAQLTHQHQMESKDDQLNSQSRELTSHTLQLAQVNELTNEILSMTEAKEESSAMRLRKIQDRIKQYKMQDNMWEIFKTYFEQIHPEFFKTLYRLHPDLSPNEVRMCAYVMLNLTTKEIASLSNRSVRTVETVKYRLHKKLGLEEETTVAYLNRIFPS